MASRNNTSKGIFGKARLPVSASYLTPRPRRRMLLWGAMACAAVIVYATADLLLLGGSSLSAGDLSVHHAMYSNDCARCHAEPRAAVRRKCAGCHEKSGDDIGVYSMRAHYRYRSDDPAHIRRGVEAHGDDMQCADCHSEHKGREASISAVTDAQCITCHDAGSFTGGHPQFEFARTQAKDDSALLFTHIRHMKFVSEKLAKERGITYLEQSCLYCHVPAPDGKNFKPLDFDTQCGDCHLTVTSETASLPVADVMNPAAPGVETLEMIQRRGGPGTRWAFYTNPNEFSGGGGGRVKKSPVYHKDPWVLENLRRLRGMLYTDLGISDLLLAAGSTLQPRTRAQYREAVRTLQGYADELRSRPEQEIQDDLVLINDALKKVAARLEHLSDTLPASAFELAMSRQNPNITPAMRAEINDLALKLAKPCLVCHVVADASVQAVAADQRILRRAEFNHRAHIVDSRCLDCHTEIPITKEMAGKTPVGLLADRAAVQNIPKKENCEACHSSSRASTNCVSCHSFHPDKTQRANLTLFVNDK